MIKKTFEKLFERTTRSKSDNFGKSNQNLGLEGRYRPTEKVVANLESEQRKASALEKLRYAVREFGRAAPKIGYMVPKEQQIGIDLNNKLLFDHENNSLIIGAANQKAYYYEVGTVDKKSYTMQDGTEVLAKRFSLQEQLSHTKLIQQDGQGDYKLHNKDETVHDTGNKSSKGKVGEVAYAVTLDGKLITHEHIAPWNNTNKGTEYGYYHSSLLGGKPGLCFGMMKVEDGKITYIDTNSGHYKPTQENLYNVVKILQNVIADDAKIVSQSVSYDKNINQLSYQSHTENKEQFLQRMETKGKDGLTMPERYFGGLNKYNEMYNNKLNDSKSSHAEKILEERKDTTNLSKSII